MYQFVQDTLDAKQMDLFLTRPFISFDYYSPPHPPTPPHTHTHTHIYTHSLHAAAQGVEQIKGGGGEGEGLNGLT